MGAGVPGQGAAAAHDDVHGRDPLRVADGQPAGDVAAHRRAHDAGLPNAQRVQHRGHVVGHVRQGVGGGYVPARAQIGQRGGHVHIGQRRGRHGQAHVAVVEPNDAEARFGEDRALLLGIFDGPDLFAEAGDQDERASVRAAAVLVVDGEPVAFDARHDDSLRWLYSVPFSEVRTTFRGCLSLPLLGRSGRDARVPRELTSQVACRLRC